MLGFLLGYAASLVKCAAASLGGSVGVGGRLDNVHENRKRSVKCFVVHRLVSFQVAPPVWGALGLLQG